MRNRSVTGAIAVAVLGGGCQSYTSGVQLICESPTHCVPCQSLEGEARVEALEEYIETHLRNEDAKQALRSLKDAPPDERGAQLRRIATEASVAACPMVAVLDAGSPVPAGPKS